MYQATHSEMAKAVAGGLKTWLLASGVAFHVRKPAKPSLVKSSQA